MSKEFAKQLLEHYNTLKSIGEITEAADKEQYTDATLALHQPKFNRALIEKASAELIATQLFEVGTMSGPVEKTPVEVYNREGGVTTTEVTEGGTIMSGKTTYSSVTIEAVGYKLKSTLTAEAIEDAQNAGNLNIVARAIANLAKDITEEIDAKLMALMVSGAAAGNVDVPKGAQDAKTYAGKIVEAIVDSLQNVKKKNYRPDFVLVDPIIFGYLAKNDEFVHADKYGSTQLQQTGFMGKIRGLEVFESNNMAANKGIVGKRRTFGVYKVYIPMMFRGPVYDPNTDKEVYVVRQRAAMKIGVGEALATFTLTA
jgi:hypothetical protein